MKITVFTPTYNRAHTLTRLFESLCAQTFHDFEWLIIDDGSIDDTETLIGRFVSQQRLNIRYYKVPNGGKHRAINKASDLANGEIFFIVDSDDYLTADALAKLKFWFEEIKESKQQYIGVAGLKGCSSSDMVGTTFTGTARNVLYFDRTGNNISGDKAEAFYTCLLKKYKFPTFENENFLTEAVVWGRMAQDGYYLRYYNQIIYITEYLSGGLTKSSIELRRKNIQGTLYAYNFLARCPFPLNLKLRYLLNYIRFYILNVFYKKRT